MSPLSLEQVLQATRRAREDPAWFFETIGISPWGKQLEIVESLSKHEKTLVYSCVSSGKSFIGGAIVPWWLMSRQPARVFIIAPTERQIKVNLWSELSKVYMGSKIPLGGDMQSLDWKIAPNLYAKGFSPKDALGVFGIHGPNDLVLFDDAQGIALEVFDAFENAAAAGTAKYLFFCNPTFNNGMLYEAITSKRGDFHCIKIDAYDTPNVKEGRVVVPGLIIKEKVDEWIRKYGWDSDFVRVKVRALPPKQEPDTLIPLDWLEMAVTREVPDTVRELFLGVDVARFGDDSSVICAKKGKRILPFADEWVMQGNDVMEVAGRVAQLFNNAIIRGAKVDEIGVGGGVVDRLVEQGFKVQGINVSEKAHDEERFVNLRSEMWWTARESLDPTNPAAMALPKDDGLIADLSAMKYKVDSSGRIKVESKEETKKRLGRSPDKGDAYAMSVFEDYAPWVKPAAAFAVSAPSLGAARLPSWL